METSEQKEIKKTDSKKVLSILIAVSAVFLLAGLLMNIMFAKSQLEFPLDSSVWNMEFILSLAEMVVMLGLVIMLAITALDIKVLKWIFIPAFLAAAVSLTSVTLAVIDVVNAQSGFGSSIILFLMVYVALIVAYVSLGLYSLKKSIAISFAVIFATLSLGVSIGFNIDKIIYIIMMDAEFKYMLPYLIMICVNLGVALLVWSLCVIMPPETKDKDIIKKNIALSVILSVITLGVYAVFWVKSITDDIAKLEGTEVNSSIQTAMFFIVPFFAIYWLYTKGKKTAALSKDADMSILFAVQGLFLLCFFSLALLQHQLHLATGLSKAK